jgi:hypothetical protein
MNVDDKEKATMNFNNDSVALNHKYEKDLKLWSGEAYGHQIVFLVL